MAVVILASQKCGQSANARLVVMSSDVFVKLADQMEQQLAADWLNGNSQFVDDNDIIAQQRLGEPTAATSRLLLLAG